MATVKRPDSVSKARIAPWDAFRCHSKHVCETNGSSLTKLRELALAELWLRERPIGAYELADQMSERTTSRVAPNSVYRILEFLQSLGLVYRIESKHAYAIVRQDRDPADVLLLCDDCGGVTEVSDTSVRSLVNARSEELGFHPARQVIEVAGRCHDCGESAAAHG